MARKAKNCDEASFRSVYSFFFNQIINLVDKVRLHLGIQFYQNPILMVLLTRTCKYLNILLISIV